MNTEWYVQDNWRVKQNFTIDAGLRFYYLTPTQSEGDEVAAFGPNVWQASQAPLLYTPVVDAAGPAGAEPGRPARSSRSCTSGAWCRAPATSSTAWRCSTGRRSRRTRSSWRRASASRGT